MKLKHMPDPGAYITVTLRNGERFTGFVDKGHVWASDDNDDPPLCLATSSHESPPTEGGENLYHYIDTAEIVSFTWDCRP